MQLNDALIKSCTVDLFDHFIRSYQDLRWNSKAELLCRLEVDDQLELSGPLYRQVGWLSALENFIHILGGSAKHVIKFHPVRHEPTSFNKSTLGVYRRKPSLGYELTELCSITVHETRWSN